MPVTRVNRETLNNHIHYHRWVYILIIIAAWFVVDMAFTMTEYHPPAEKKVDIYCVGPYMDQEKFDELSKDMLPNYPQLEAISFYTIVFSDPNDMYATQKFTVMLGAQEGDIMFMHKDLFEQLAKGGAAEPLDQYIESGALDLHGTDVSAQTFAADVEDGVDTQVHLYGIPLDGLTVLFNDYLYDVREQVAMVMAYSRNKDNAAPVLSDILARTTPDA